MVVLFSIAWRYSDHCISIRNCVVAALVPLLATLVLPCDLSYYQDQEREMPTSQAPPVEEVASLADVNEAALQSFCTCPRWDPYKARRSSLQSCTITVLRCCSAWSDECNI